MMARRLADQRRWLTVFTALGMYLLLGALPAGSQDSSPLFRQIFVPKNDLSNFAQGTMAVRRQQFEQLVAAAAQATGAPEQSPVRVVAAQYYARLDDDTLVDGTAMLSIRNSADSPALLDLGLCHLPIRDSYWVGDTSDDALLGSDAEGHWHVRVDSDAKLGFAWTLRGRTDSSDELQFAFELPPSPSIYLTLDLPEGVRPLTSVGVARIAVEDESVASIDTVAAVAPNFRRWMINLGGHASFTLLIAPEEQAASQPLVVLRQFDTFAVEADGVDMTTEIHLDVHHRALRVLLLEVDERLRIKEVQVAGRRATWSLAEEALDGRVVARIDFDEALTGVNEIVRIIGFAPLAVDQPFLLPAIIPRDMFWQEGRALVTIGRQLVLASLEAKGCQQTQIESLPPPQAGQQIAFQYFNPHAEIELSALRQRGGIVLDGGVTVQLSEAAISGRLVADFRCVTAERFELEAIVPGPWVIDDLRTEPATALNNWTTRNESEGWQRLHVSLHEAITPNRPVRLIVLAHRLPVPPRVELPLEQLRIAQFDQIDHAEMLMAIDAEPPYRLVVHGENELNLLSVDTLTDDEKTRIDSRPDSFLFVDGSAVSSLRVAIETQRVRYSADIEIEIDIEPRIIEQRIVVRCVPDATPVSQLLIHITAPDDHLVQWRLAGETESSLEKRRLTSEEQREAGFAAEGQTWRITLHRPRTVPFEIRGLLRFPWEDATALPLLALQGADRQRAVIDVAVTGAVLARVTAAHHLVRLPLESPRVDASSALVARYRYDPVRDVFATSQPVLAVEALPASTDPANLLAWNVEVNSLLGIDGRVAHVARFELENLGRSHIGVTLNKSMRLEDVIVDGHSFSPGEDELETGNLVVPLPKTVRFPVLEIHYTTVGDRPRWRTPIEMPYPQVEVPILSRQGVLWLPPETAPCDSGEGAGTVGWAQRLFGPLARRPSDRPMNFLTPSRWRLPATASWELQASVDEANRLLTDIGLAMASAQPPTTWGELLAASRLPEGASDRLPLIIDRRGLALLGIRADTKVIEMSFERKASALERGMAVLSRHALCLAIDQQGLLLTHTGILQSGASQTAEAGTAGVVLLNDSPLVAYAFSPEGSGSSGDESKRYVSEEQWSDSKAGIDAPWNQTMPLATSMGTGWRPRIYIPTDDVPAVVLVFRPARVQIWAWLALLLSAALAAGLARRGAAAWFILASVACAAALLGPGSVVPLTSSVFLGVCAGGLCSLFRKEGMTTAAPAKLPAISSLPIATIIVLGALLAGMLLFGSPAWAQTDPANDEQEERTPYRVVVPIDDDQQPVGDYVYIPREFYNRLFGLGPENTSHTHDWLIKSAQYDATIRHTDSDVPALLGELTAHYEVEVFRGDVVVRLPLDRETINLPPDGITVDDSIVEATWSDDGSSLQVPVERPGSYRIALRLLPTSRAAAAGTFSTPVAPVPEARLHISLPSDLEEVELPTALGEITRDDDQIEADLGPTTTLSFQWNRSESEQAKIENVVDEQLLWLRVRPGEVVLDAKFKLRGGRGQRESFVLLADPRLRLLPVDGVRSVPGDPQTIIINPASSRDEASTEIVLSFLLDDTSGVGNLRLPLLTTRNAPVERRMLAVSIDPSLSASRTPHELVQPINADIFIEAWGLSRDVPGMTFELLSPQADWRMTTFPIESAPTAIESNHWRFEAERARVRYTADIDLLSGALFQHQIRGPRDFNVSNVSLLVDGDEHAWQWSREDDGTIHIFAGHPITGPHRLIIEGDLEVPSEGEAIILPLALKDVSAQSRQLSIWRTSSVLCRIIEASDCTPLEEVDEFPRDTADDTPHLPSRNVGRWRADSEDWSVRVELAPNDMRLDGELITIVDHEEIWKATVELTATVKQGVVDVLYLRLPSWWGDDLTLDPEAPFELRADSRRGDRLLVIRPTQSIRGRFQWRITGPLSAVQGEPLRVPNVELVDSNMNRYLLLPARDGDQPLSWETVGLQGRPMPEEALARGWSPETWDWYQVTGDGFQVQRLPTTPHGSAAMVKLADYTISLSDEGLMRGVARFDLDPGERRSCDVELPGDCRILRAIVAGVPVALVNPDAQHQTLELGLSRLPQRIELVFEGRAVSTDKQEAEWQTLGAPSLVGISVDKTLWTVLASSSLIITARDDNIQIISEGDQAYVRMESAAALIDAAEETVSGLDNDEIGRWYLPWAQQYMENRQCLMQQRRANPADTLDRDRLDGLEARQAVLAERLGLTRLRTSIELESGHRDTPLVSWQRDLESDTAPLKVMVLGAAPRLQIQSIRLSQTGSTSLLLRILIYLSLLGAVIWLFRNSALLGWFERWPRLAVVLAGLAWWMFLTPSVVGWVIIALALVSQLSARKGNALESQGGMRLEA